MSTRAIDPYAELALGVEAAWPPSFHNFWTQQADRLPKRSWLGPLLGSLRNPPVRPFPSTPNTA